MKSNYILFLLLVSCFVSAPIFAQKIGMNTVMPDHPVHIQQPNGMVLDNFQPVMKVQYNGSNSADAIGIQGVCNPIDFFGIGGDFSGGFTGVQGQVISAMNNHYRGVYGRTLGAGSGSYVGVNGIGASTSGQGTTYGVFGDALGGTTGIGVYGSASGASTNWAGFFSSGRVYIENVLGIGHVNPTAALDIMKNQSSIRAISTGAVNGSVLDLRNLTANATYIGAINFSTNAEGSTPGQIGYFADDRLSFRVNFVERFRIISSGFLGIGLGSNNPAHPVHIQQPSGTILANGQPVMHVEYTGTNLDDAIGVRAKCKPTDFFGIGGEFEGGWIGARGRVNGAGGAGHNYYGIRGEATGGSGTKFGVYGFASGGGTNWAGYFDGRIYVNTRIGIAREPITNELEVEGTASKTAPGDWIGNSDSRLKKNIQALDSRDMLDKLLSLQGITYEWDDDKTGSNRPDGVHYGFTAQNIQEVFPTLVEEDAQGYLQTAYGTYDAMTVESLRALQQQIDTLKSENTMLKNDLLLIKEMLTSSVSSK